MDKKYIDAHCHVFNKDIITVRILVQLIKAIIESLREHDEELKSNKIEHKRIRNLIDKIKRINNFLKTGFQNSSIDIFKSLEEVYSPDFIAVPLMFDLEYCFIGTKAEKFKLPEKIDHLNKHLVTHIGLFESLVNDIAHLAIKNLSEEQAKGKKTGEKENYNFFNSIRELLEHKSEFDQIVKKLDIPETETKRLLQAVNHQTGFQKQLEEIKALKKAYPKMVYPFFAVDPRRPGILEQMKKLVKPGKKSSFLGVKLYTPNGYSPTDPVLMNKNGVYDYCQQNNIPITAHCSRTGFATLMETINVRGIIYKNEELKKVSGKITFDTKLFENEWIKERAETLNHPLIWNEVLKKYPKLKLNLAHFGNGSNEWTNLIYQYMNNYENLYTDFSCVSDLLTLSSFKKNYYEKANTKVKEKFLYGSDYYLNLTKSSSFETYVQNFHKIFSKNDFNKIAIDNNYKFLGLEPGF